MLMAMLFVLCLDDGDASVVGDGLFICDGDDGSYWEY